MSDTLRDQLLGLGFKPAPKPDSPQRRDGGKPGPVHPPSARPQAHRPGKQPPRANRPPRENTPPRENRPPHARRPPQHGKLRSQEDIDLAKAYAIRAQREKDERIEAERLKQEQARERREAKAKLGDLLKDKALNDANADIARHFDYGGKIKRIHVNAAQLKSLNAGELGVVQLDGRYLLVTAALLDEAEAIFAPAVALRIDPNATAEADPYADPQYQIPDDLVW